MEERLAREIGVLEREHFPLLRGGLLPGLLHLLRRPRGSLEERGALFGSRRGPMVLERARPEQRMRPEDLLALLRSRLLPALLDRLAALPECLEEERLLVRRGVLPAALERSLSNGPRRRDHFLRLGLLRLRGGRLRRGRRSGLDSLGLFGGRCLRRDACGGRRFRRRFLRRLCLRRLDLRRRFRLGCLRRFGSSLDL